MVLDIATVLAKILIYLIAWKSLEFDLSCYPSATPNTRLE